jgi:hypothetical protein
VAQPTKKQFAALQAERDALVLKTSALADELARAHALVLHIEDVISDEAFDVIDVSMWNGVTSDMPLHSPQVSGSPWGVTLQQSTATNS